MSTQTKFSTKTILGVEVDNLGLSDALDEIYHLVKIGPAQSYYIVKPYVEHIDYAARSNYVRKILNQAYLSLPDGVSLNWAAYFEQETQHRRRDLFSSLAKIFFKPLELHLALPNYSWGTNFTWSLLQMAAERKLKVYLVGSPKHSDINHTKAFLTQQIKDLKIVGTMDGRDPLTSDFSKHYEADLLAQLQKLKPDIVLVGIGFPAQEKLIVRLCSQLHHGVLIAEGGTFDYANFGGQLKKAPLFMQRHGLEWLWRLVREPSRLKRQLAIPRFIWKVYAAYRK